MGRVGQAHSTTTPKLIIRIEMKVFLACFLTVVVLMMNSGVNAKNYWQMACSPTLAQVIYGDAKKDEITPLVTRVLKKCCEDEENDPFFLMMTTAKLIPKRNMYCNMVGSTRKFSNPYA